MAEDREFRLGRREVVVWAIMGAVLLLFFGALCTWGGQQPSLKVPPPLPKRPAVYKPASGVSAGAGAMLLTAPRLVVPAMITNWLAWDYAATNWAAVSNFALLSGSVPGLFPLTNLVGLTLSNRFVQPKGSQRFAVVQAVGTNGSWSTNSNLVTVPATNVIITVNCAAGGTNIQSRSWTGGSWTWRNTTNLVLTNPAPGMMFRGMGAAGNRVAVRRGWQ